MNNFDFQTDYESLVSHYPNHTARPVIGISGNYTEGNTTLAEGYYKSIEQAGGIPVIIPPTDNRVLLTALLDRIDGLLLSGGADVNPLYCNEEPQKALGSTPAN